MRWAFISVSAALAGCMATPPDDPPRIESGHWAFQPITRPEPPAVANAAWVKSSIDVFVLAKLEAEGKEPAPEADRAKLFRRASLDLTGLPPSLDELHAYLADPAPDAYERAIDRLLESPRFGEHFARDWLDAARYADSLGFQVDQPSTMWAYREWVIDAFDRGMSFDQFTIEQLAGDLLPDATYEQKIATGFNRNHPITIEGGTIDEEYRMYYALDRASTVSTVWLGLTFGCARCHDHKYDPLPQADFYSLLDCFHRVPDRGWGPDNNFAPTISVHGPLQVKRIDELVQKERMLETILDPASWLADEVRWETESLLLPAPVWVPGAPISASAASGAAIRADTDGTYTVTGPNPPIDTLDLVVSVPIGGVRAMKIEVHGGRAGDHNFFVSELATWRLEPLAPGSIDPEEMDRVPANLIDGFAIGGGNSGAFAIDGSGKTGWSATTPAEGSTGVFAFEAPLTAAAPAIVRIRIAQEHGEARTLGSFRVTFSDHPLAAMRTPIDVASQRIGGMRTDEETKDIYDYYLRFAARPALMEAARSLMTVERALAVAREAPRTMIMADDDSRETFVLFRGDFEQKGDRVTCNVPRALPAMPEDLPRNRLGIAKWLVGGGNPLTPRVIANHYFGLIFGEPLVRTPEDFGMRGQPPTHPELLDWLAYELLQSGWKLKPFIRTMVTSATYRTSSRATFAEDPENRLLARSVRRRLPAEVVRDQALLLAGLLVEERGGPSVLPYHPSGLWEELNDNNGAVLHYRHDRGANLYRRSMYSFWKRTIHQPSMAILDAPSRELAIVHRNTSNTALQPLVLLDDPQLVEAARKFGDRMRAAGPTPEARIRAGFEMATSRVPSADELAVLLEVYRAELEVDAKQALAFLQVGESSHPSDVPIAEQNALGAVGRILLNLAETVERE